MSVVRSTISFTPQNWGKVTSAANKSKVVNTAVEYYFRAQDYLAKKEEEFILQELKHYKKTGERYTFEEVFGQKKWKSSSSGKRKNSSKSLLKNLKKK
ncbi:hypothetical protein HZA38_06140 [Candidatus Peregrinibacteria bacterium]|nr:hypothetical protein [Candidatus Peregrinibacteria bacterium]